jgi:hypothetical protein
MSLWARAPTFCRNVFNVCKQDDKCRKVASSRPVLDPLGQRSQYISIKFPLHKQSENMKMCYYPRQSNAWTTSKAGQFPSIIDLWKILSPRQIFQNLQGTCPKHEPASSTVNTNDQTTTPILME